MEKSNSPSNSDLIGKSIGNSDTGTIENYLVSDSPIPLDSSRVEDSLEIKENPQVIIEPISDQEIVEIFEEINSKLNRTPDETSYVCTLKDLKLCFNYVMYGCIDSEEFLEELSEYIDKSEHHELFNEIYDDFVERSNDVHVGIMNLLTSHNYKSNGEIIKDCISKLFGCKVTLYEMNNQDQVPFDYFDKLDFILNQLEVILNEIMLTFKEGVGTYDGGEEYEKHLEFLHEKELEFDSIKIKIEDLSIDFKDKIVPFHYTYKKDEFKTLQKLLTKLESMYENFEILFLTEFQRCQIIEDEWIEISKEIYKGEVLDNYDLHELLER